MNTNPIPDNMSVIESDAQVTFHGVAYPNTVTNLYRGVYQGQPARFIERRQLSCHTRAGVDVRAVGSRARRCSTQG